MSHDARTPLTGRVGVAQLSDYCEAIFLSLSVEDVTNLIEITSQTTFLPECQDT